jgi:hypothetical protein
MAGTFTTLMLSGLLAQAPGGFTFEGREASARTEQPDGFFIQGPLPFTDLAERGSGSASLQVEDRVSLPGATWGDVGQLSATFRLGAVVYRVELARPGFPPAQALSRAPSGPLPQPPPHTIQGGVLLDVPLYGDSGVGWTAMTRTHAAAAVWGVGSVWRNGQLVTDTAFVHAAALAAGAYADDDTHRLLRQARFGDSELVVVVWNLPPELEPRGFVQFVFEDVSMSVGGTSVPSRTFVENTANPPANWNLLTPVPPTTILGAPSTASPQPSGQQQGVGGGGTAGTSSTNLATARGGSPETTPGAADELGLAGGGRDILGTGQGSVTTVGGAATAGRTDTGDVVDTAEGVAPGSGTGTQPAAGSATDTGVSFPQSNPGVIGGPVTATTPAPAAGTGTSLSAPQASVGGVAGGALVTPPNSPVSTLPGAQVRGQPVTPDVSSGTFPVTGAPNPPVNISGSLPGTPAPGSQLAARGALVPGTAPPGAPSGFGPSTRAFAAPGSATSGSFSVQPVAPSNFSAFAGTAQVSPGIVATAPPLNSDPQTPPPALLGSPAPLTAAQAPPLLGTPAPLNSAPATALPSTPAPGNSAPGAATATPVAPSVGVPPGSAVTAPAAPVTPPGSVGVPPSI